MGSLVSVADELVLLVDGSDVVAPADWPFTADALVDGPWACVARTGVSLRLDDLADVDEPVARELEAAGVERVVCRPVWADRVLIAVAVTCRGAETVRPAGATSPVDIIDLVDSAGLGAADDRTAPARDGLTQVASSGGLQDEIDRGDGDAVVLYVDLDGLDHVNDSYGSAAGDAVLIEVARRLERAARVGDRVFRMTGDEFVVVIRGAEQLDSIQTAAQVIDELALPYAVSSTAGVDELVSVTAGVGMCVPSDGTRFDLAVYAALTALGEAKLAGHDRLHIVGR